MVKTALISVSNKEGIVEFAKELSKLNIKILSSGGTASLLQKNKVPVTPISDYIESGCLGFYRSHRKGNRKN